MLPWDPGTEALWGGDVEVGNAFSDCLELASGGSGGSRSLILLGGGVAVGVGCGLGVGLVAVLGVGVVMGDWVDFCCDGDCAEGDAGGEGGCSGSGLPD